MIEQYALPHPGHPLIAKKLYKVPVRVLINDSYLCRTIHKVEFWIIARSAVDAANWARDKMQYLPETEIKAWGPKGGEVYRYVGWQSAIGASLFRPKNTREILDGMEEVLGCEVDWSKTNLLLEQQP